jgi:type II secretion system protein D
MNPFGRAAQVGEPLAPSGHGAVTSLSQFRPLQVALRSPECLEYEACDDSPEGFPSVPPAIAQGHCSAVYCGSELDYPLMAQSCDFCSEAQTSMPVAMAMEDLPALPEPEPFAEPIAMTPPPILASEQLEAVKPLQASARKYPLFETDPSHFIAEEPVPPALLPTELKTARPLVQDDRNIAAVPKPINPQGYLINFQNVSMSEYVKFVAQLTGKNFIYNSDDLQFAVTIVSKEPTTLDNIMAALLQELRIHGLAMLEQGNNLIIYKQAGVVSPASLFSDELHAPQEIVTRVFRIEHVAADKISEIVTRMLSDQALVQTLSDSNSLIITDLSTNVDRISQIIRVLDIPSQTYEVGQYVATNGLVSDIIPIAEQILAPLASGRPPVLVAQPNTNSVYIVASPELMKQAISVLRKLDAPTATNEILTLEQLKLTGTNLPRDRFGVGAQGAGLAPGAPFQHPSELHTKFYLYRLQFRTGDQIQDALYRIADSLRLDEKANIDLINAINSVQWLEASNSLVITGTDEAIGRVKELMEELDISLRQILLEMLILDTTITDSLEFSVDLGDQFSSQFVGSAFANNTPLLDGTTVFPFPIAQTAAGTIVPGLVAPPTAVLQHRGFNLGIIGRRIFKGDNAFTTIGALVRAVHIDRVAEIVLNPKILVEDNFPAEVFVGVNTPYATQSVVNQNSNFVTQNVEYRDVGTTLRVTPQIGNGDMITLTIEEEVSEIAAVTSLNGATTPLLAPTTNKSNTITKVHVPDGYFVILSGVIRSKDDRLRTQVPCLGGVPIIGSLVGSKTNLLEKRNILIFIRPQIIDEDCDYHEVTRHQQNIYKEKNKRKPRWKYETDEALDYLNLPRFDDGCPPRDWEYGSGGW